MTEASAGQATDRRQRFRRRLWNLMYVLIGAVAASVWWIRIYDPSLLKQKQETISIKRIEYVDGSVWQRP